MICRGETIYAECGVCGRHLHWDPDAGKVNADGKPEGDYVECQLGTGKRCKP